MRNDGTSEFLYSSDGNNLLTEDGGWALKGEEPQISVESGLEINASLIH